MGLTHTLALRLLLYIVPSPPQALYQVWSNLRYSHALVTACETFQSKRLQRLRISAVSFKVYLTARQMRGRCWHGGRRGGLPTYSTLIARLCIWLSLSHREVPPSAVLVSLPQEACWGKFVFVVLPIVVGYAVLLGGDGFHYKVTRCSITTITCKSLVKMSETVMMTWYLKYMWLKMTSISLIVWERLLYLIIFPQFHAESIFHIIACSTFCRQPSLSVIVWRTIIDFYCRKLQVVWDTFILRFVLFQILSCLYPVTSAPLAQSKYSQKICCIESNTKNNNRCGQ